MSWYVFTAIKLNFNFMSEDLKKNKEFWDRIKLDASLEYSRQILDNFIAGASLRDKYILDAGSGLGVYTFLFCERGAKVIGTDISLNSLAIAKNKLLRYNYSNAHFIQSDVRFLPLKSKFDLIWSFGCLCYVENPLLVIESWANLLNSGGQIIVSMEKRNRMALFLNFIRKSLYRLPKIILNPLAAILALFFFSRAIVFRKKEKGYSNLINLIMGQFWPIKTFITEEDFKGYYRSKEIKHVKTVDLGRTLVFILKKE